MQRSYHLAQVNLAKALAPLDSPPMQGFVEQLDHVNQLAEASAGFVWRLQTDAGDATALQPDEDERIIVNLSVWDSLEALKTFVYSGEHLGLLRNKKHWFERPDAPILALWWASARPRRGQADPGAPAGPEPRARRRRPSASPRRSRHRSSVRPFPRRRPERLPRRPIDNHLITAKESPCN
ncbi:DUF3291 domain-containing protein [Pseudomonas sp.]|uniref:DUF3291 domain-containing protein n=1 Tax=Pseudomonas sp. TaxID=306 RepID=UPI0035690A37